MGEYFSFNTPHTRTLAGKKMLAMLSEHHKIEVQISDTHVAFNFWCHKLIHEVPMEGTLVKRASPLVLVMHDITFLHTFFMSLKHVSLSTQ